MRCTGHSSSFQRALPSLQCQPLRGRCQSLRAEVVLAIVTSTRKEVRDALQEVVEEGEDVHDALDFFEPTHALNFFEVC